MYALRTQRIWSSVVLRPVLIAGIATFTIVVSSMIMKKPVVKTSKTSHGLVRACAMSPPQLCVVGIDSDLPLQLAFGDFLLEIADPPAFGVEHRDLVLELDESETADASRAELGHDLVQLFRRGLQGRDPTAQVSHRLAAADVMHKHQSGGEMWLLAPRVAQDVT